MGSPGLVTVAVRVAMMASAVSPEAATQPGGTAPQTPDARIAALIVRLGSNKYADRDAAQKALVVIGRPAIAPLKAALADKDLERRVRAQEALRQIDHRYLLTENTWPNRWEQISVSMRLTTRSGRDGTMSLRIDPNGEATAEIWDSPREKLTGYQSILNCQELDRLAWNIRQQRPWELSDTLKLPSGGAGEFRVTIDVDRRFVSIEQPWPLPKDWPRTRDNERIVSALMAIQNAMSHLIQVVRRDATIRAQGGAEGKAAAAEAAKGARAALPGGGGASWRALAARVRPGMTVRQMKVLLPPARPRPGEAAQEVVILDGARFTIGYPLDAAWGVSASGIAQGQKQDQWVLDAPPQVNPRKDLPTVTTRPATQPAARDEEALKRLGAMLAAVTPADWEVLPLRTGQVAPPHWPKGEGAEIVFRHTRAGPKGSSYIGVWIMDRSYDGVTFPASNNPTQRPGARELKRWRGRRAFAGVDMPQTWLSWAALEKLLAASASDTAPQTRPAAQPQGAGAATAPSVGPEQKASIAQEVAGAMAKAVTEHSVGYRPPPGGNARVPADWSLVCHDDTKMGGKALNRSAAMDALVAKMGGPMARGAGAQLDRYVEAAGGFLSYEQAPYRAVACELLYRFPELMVELGLVPKVGALLDDRAVAFEGADVMFRSVGPAEVTPGVKLTVAEIAQRTLSAATSCLLPNEKVFRTWWAHNSDFRHRLWYWALRWHTAKPEDDLAGLGNLDPRHALKILLLVANNPAGRRESLLGFPSPAELRKLPSPKDHRPEPCYHLQAGPQPATIADFVRKHSLKSVLMDVLRQKVPWPEVAGSEEMGTLLHQAVPVMALVFDRSDAAEVRKVLADLSPELKRFRGLEEQLGALAADLSRKSPAMHDPLDARTPGIIDRLQTTKPKGE